MTDLLPVNPILAILLECLGWCFRWLLFLPALILGATPFILVVATFRPRPYRERVRELYGSVFDFWRSWGGDLTP